MGPTKKANSSGGFAASLLSGHSSDKVYILVDELTCFTTLPSLCFADVLLCPSFTSLQIHRICSNATIRYLSILEICILMFFFMNTSLHPCWTSSHSHNGSLLLQLGLKELWIRRTLGDTPWGLYPMRGQQLITHTWAITLQQEQVCVWAGTAYSVLIKGFVALPLEVLTFLPCQRCSWCAKEIGVGSPGEYNLLVLAVHIAGCFTFSATQYLSLIFCSSQRLTIRWQRRTWWISLGPDQQQ
jgi:hypothetical protein